MKFIYKCIDMWQICGCKCVGFQLGVEHQYTCDSKKHDLTFLAYVFRWYFYFSFIW